MFNFRIITTADGNQIIDRKLKTPYESLDIFKFMEYLEAEESMEHMDIMENKARQMAERKRKLARNPLYKLACVLGLF